jgi:hypothetical protein
VGFEISGVEPWGSATTVLDLMEIGCEDGRWMELAQDSVQWRALVLAVMNVRMFILEFWLDKVGGSEVYCALLLPALVIIMVDYSPS